MGAFSIFEQLHQPFLLWFANREREFLDKLLREDLDRALAALPEHYRLVVLLADVEGLKYADGSGPVTIDHVDPVTGQQAAQTSGFAINPGGVIVGAYIDSSGMQHGFVAVPADRQ